MKEIIMSRNNPTELSIRLNAKADANHKRWLQEKQIIRDGEIRIMKEIEALSKKSRKDKSFIKRIIDKIKGMS